MPETHLWCSEQTSRFPCSQVYSSWVVKVTRSFATVIWWVSVVGRWFRFKTVQKGNAYHTGTKLQRLLFMKASSMQLLSSPTSLNHWQRLPTLSTAFSSEKVRKRFLVSLVDSKKVHPWAVVAMEIQDPSPNSWGVGHSKGQEHQDNTPP